jgi:exopolysaccharide biosynthesis polyprenyl glycosylphosphotransferase
LLVFGDAAVLIGYLFARPEFWFAALGLWAATVGSFRAHGVYRPRLHLSLLDDTPTLVWRSAIATALVGVILVWQLGVEALHEFAVLAAFGLSGHLLARMVAYRVIRWVRATKRVSYRTLVIGGGTVSQKIVETIAHHPDYGLSVIGYVDDVPSVCSQGPPGWVYRGGVDELPATISKLEVQALLVGFGHFPDTEAVEALRDDVTDPPTVFMVPRLFEYGGRWAMQDHIGAIPIIRVNRTCLRGPRWRLKRAFDLITVAFLLVLLAPVMAAVALAVRIEGGPGVIFRQQRVGRNGRLFDVLKFRSMRPSDPGESDVRWSIAHDQRVGPVGRFIRRASLDELPQLINVLRGDMTIVGPRPERPHFVASFSEQLPHYPHRHRVPVGLTGLAQVNGLRGNTSIEERARYDNYYIENWSLWLDIKVMLQTLSQLTRPDGS